MRTTLIVVRHGETQWNAVGKQQGHLDSPLSELGIRQADLLAGALVSRKIDVVYSSDLGRALQTAGSIVKRLRLDIHTDSRLRERHLGVMQGLTKQQFAQRFPQAAEQLDTRNPQYGLPGGESVIEISNRCVSCVDELVSRYTGKRILIVGHGGVLSSLFYRATNTPLTEPRRFSLFNASINSISVDEGEWRLDSWGETGHLDDVSTEDDH